MTIGNLHTPIITLNVNGLNSPITRHRIAYWIKKKIPTLCCLQETHQSCKDKVRLKEKRWKTILQANGIHRKAGVAILVSDKIDFRITKVTKDKDVCFVMTKGTLHQEIIHFSVHMH